MQSRAASVVGDPTFSARKQIAALILFNLLLVALSPYILLQKLSRMRRKKRRHELDLRRWTLPAVGPDVALAPHSGPRVVLMALAFGELRLVETISDRLAKARPDLNLIWAIRDQATIDLCAKSRPQQPVVIWPFDNGFPASKWTQEVRPDLLIIPEKVWPANILSLAKLHGAKIAVVNGRTVRRDRIRDRIKAPYYRWVIQNVDLFCFQSDTFLQRLSHLLRPSGARLVTGNMKLDQHAPPLAEERKDAIRRWLAPRGETPLLAAGSTGPPGDEEFVLTALNRAREHAPAALLLAPRSMHRVPDVIKAVEEAGLTYSLRSAPNESAVDVYILDTMGELAFAYQFAVAAFIGGTLTSTGHNVIEPIVWGIPVSYGPRRGHFEDLQQLCESFRVGFRCQSVDDLAAHWAQALVDPAFRETIREQSRQLIEHASGATDRTIEALLELIGPPASILHS